MSEENCSTQLEVVTGTTSTGFEQLEVISFADMEEKRKNFLIPMYVPQGDVTIIAGPGGVGKTMWECSIAAAVSAGRRTLMESENEETDSKAPSGKVLMLMSEDDPETVLLPRLKLFGADLKNIITIPLKQFPNYSIAETKLAKLILQERPVLVVIDPIQAWLPTDVVMNQKRQIRECMESLMIMGRTFGTTFLIAAHTNKQKHAKGRALVADSAEIHDCARSVLMVSATNEEGVNVLTHVKSNYGKKGRNILYRITEKGIEIHGRVDENLTGLGVNQEKEMTERQRCRRFLIHLMEAGEKPVKVLDADARACGFSQTAIRRSKQGLREEGLLQVNSTGFGKDKQYTASLVSETLEGSDKREIRSTAEASLFDQESQESSDGEDTASRAYCTPA